MSDANSLRTLLTRVDATAPGIQSCAAAMMRHYDRSAEVAVVEWRNALHNSNREQWLPLLYVANEVLQNSKRNRGNKFLEAFSPVLGQSLIFVSQHSDAPIVEKIRRTVKIWGDRRVFSVRYVNELLKGLEPYRNNRGASNAPIVPPPSQPPNLPSPATTTPSPHSATTTANSNDTTKPVVEESSTSNHNEEEDDDPMQIFNTDDNDEDDDDDDDNVFGNSDPGLKLDVQLDFDSSALSPHQQQRKGGIKRRRSSTASAGSQASGSKKSRRKSVLSTTSLVELWKRVSALEQSFDHSVAMIRDIQLPEPEQLESLVGDELLEHHKMILKYQERVTQQRENLHSIANERKSLEQEAVRYIPWLEAALKQDGDDLEFCKNLEANLLKFQHIHPAIRQARDKRVAEDLQHQREQEEKERKRKEEEDAKKFRELALSKETEAKRGMVWNKVTQEYQYLNTDESWRD